MIQLQLDVNENRSNYGGAIQNEHPRSQIMTQV